MRRDPSDVILQRLMALHPKLIDLTLDRVWRLLEALDNPHDDLPPVIHVAGTNGKGSTLAYLRAAFEGIGQSCHVYTSPHLVRFHERIRLAGTLISEDALSEILAECEEANGSEAITYFEITTVAAILAFARAKADWTLLEVGLGGRLDATNVVAEPAMSIITPISLDHQQFLGDTLEEIASEKAGILKRNTFCVVAPQEDAALEAIEAQAVVVGATLLKHGEHWHVWEENNRLIYQDERGLLDLPLPVLQGSHQITNAGTAIAALRYLGVEDDAAEYGVTQAQWPARMQRLHQGELVTLAPNAELWLDGGHNAAAGMALAKMLENLPDKPTYLVVGMLNTKDVSGFLRPLAEHTTALRGITIPDEAATLSAEETVAAAKGIGMVAAPAENLETALTDITQTEPNARILICGSLYFAGAVLAANGSG